MENEKPDKQSFSEWISSPQMLVALSAVLLSVCGLFLSIYETSLIRQEQRASVWPNVEVGPSLNDNHIRIFIQNTGVGPARIQAANATYKGEVQKNWGDLARNIAGDNSYPDIYQSLINGTVLSPGSEEVLVFSRKAEKTLPANHLCIH